MDCKAAEQVDSREVQVILDWDTVVYLCIIFYSIFCSTWMTSRMHFEKIGGLSFRTGIQEKGWIIIALVRRIKKKGKTKFCLKTMCTQNTSVIEDCYLTLHAVKKIIHMFTTSPYSECQVFKQWIIFGIKNKMFTSLPTKKQLHAK